MDENWQNTKRQRWFDLVLLGSRHTQNQTINSFKMAGVCTQLNRNRCTLRRNVFTFCTKVILHVATSLHGVWAQMAFKLFEDLVVTLAHDVGQHVQSTTVHHSQNDTVHARVGSTGQHCIHNGDHGLGSFETETLCAYVLCCQELFKCFSSIQTLKYS